VFKNERSGRYGRDKKKRKVFSEREGPESRSKGASTEKMARGKRVALPRRDEAFKKRVSKGGSILGAGGGEKAKRMGGPLSTLKEGTPMEVGSRRVKDGCKKWTVDETTRERGRGKHVRDTCKQQGRR